MNLIYKDNNFLKNLYLAYNEGELKIDQTEVEVIFFFFKLHCVFEAAIIAMFNSDVSNDNMKSM